MKLRVVLILILCLAAVMSVQANEFKDAGKEIGEGFKHMGKDVAQVAVTSSKAVGKGFKEAGKETGRAFKQMGHDVEKAFKGDKQ